MSVTVNFYVTDAGMLVALMPPDAVCGPLRQRFIDAELACEQQGNVQFQMRLSPLEQGLAMGVLGPVVCQFSGGLRARLQGKIFEKLKALGASEDL